MIFTSLPFLAVFLPLAVLGYALCARVGARATVAWLIVASLVFYGFWAPYLVVLIAGSIGFNYAVSVMLRRNAGRPARQRGLLVLGVSCDLAALFHYKYAYAVASFLAGYGFTDGLEGLAAVVLPLGISFFTFTQIGYLIDCKDGVTKDNDFLDYVLFVTFFPHLIAGPILHNGDMMPQFADPANRGLRAANVAPALTLFVLGALKKTLVADTLSPHVATGFDHAAGLGVVDAWLSALSYSIQLYFDFSGYSDMAIGLALLFNIRFPANFNSPYKARNISDFWQRWHMSLTRYLTQYLYNPMAMAMRRARVARGLPMSRKALESPRAFLALVAWPTVATMALAGIWHGAGFQFVVFGLLHGLYLTAFHAWRTFGPRRSAETGRVLATVGQVALTYLAVLVAQIFFRAESCAQALDLLAGMVGLHGLSPTFTAAGPGEAIGLKDQIMALARRFGVSGNQIKLAAQVACGFLIVWFLPNTQQIMARAKPILGPMPGPAPALLLWRPNAAWAVVAGVLAFVTILSLGGTSEFLYFQF